MELSLKVEMPVSPDKETKVELFTEADQVQTGTDEENCPTTKVVLEGFVWDEDEYSGEENIWISRYVISNKEQLDKLFTELYWK